ncbi:hypothetical protein [Thiothrix nivea]|uniref:Uncharacterized protein n=1 Tax=Thiothrix nivea (strain ATCC 35100 / DSM 5205 / JP2) TaxID=870187 RepID=A0A656HFA6_THINJ|nr:hypothetical protein [Thiothrix nivea]EIJ34166.1 hypothetical protein Thini_1569 [Thiothrix nivea DSM 5205]
MAFDIYALDEQEEFNDDVFATYQDGLLQLFAESTQGKQFQADTGEEPGNWAGHLLYYGYAYLGTSPPRMTPGEISEIVNDLFPRKITLFSEDDARYAMAELKAFWLFLEEMFQLGGNKAIIQVLEKAEPTFGQCMMDPANAGMAKSFVMLGKQAGFDTTTQAGLHEAMLAYNMGQLGSKLSPVGLPPLAWDGGGFPDEDANQKGHTKSEWEKKKKKLKAQKAARRKSRKKK